MRLKLWIISVLTLLLLPSISLAAEFKTSDNINIAKSETVRDDYYIAGNDITMDGTVMGDLFVAGGNVEIGGNVLGSLYIMGGQVKVSGNIEKSAKIMAGSLEMSGNIGTDLFVGSGSVDIEKEAIIKGDSHFASGNVNIFGTTGSIKASTENLSIKDGATVNGAVTYWSEKDLSRGPGAVISGDIVKNEPPARNYDFSRMNASTVVTSILFTIIIGLILVWIFPKKSVAIMEMWRDKFGFNVLWGLLFIVLAPIVSVLLLITIIGIPIAIGLFLIFLIYMYLGKLVGIIALGNFILRSFNFKDKKIILWLSVITGAVLYGLISLIPVIGPLAKALIVLSGIGVLAGISWRFLAKTER